jgi:predicted ribosome quality control (RQC) complex YloA/Tae2 family protein
MEKNKFREWFTSTGKRVLAGRNALNNEELIKQAENKEILLHTANPGSPFVNIKAKKPTKQDIYDSALFCAKYSQDWRDNKKAVKVHVFKTEDVHKERKMKTGTFGVKKFKEVTARKIDILKI